MNNNNNSNRGNNNNNNRRRGRGNNRQQGGGGGQMLNRVDSRARGNAPQMLEKYRKMAHDAHLNGDRVQEEYFLQFADHYFRVIADQRVRQDEQRSPRPSGERWQEGSEGFREDGDDGGEYGSEGEYQPYERQSYTRTDNRTERDDRPREEKPRDEQQREERPREERSREDRPRQARQRAERAEEPVVASESNAALPEAIGETQVENAAVYEPPENPFVRGSRGLRPRRPARQDSDDHAVRDDASDDGAMPHGLDPAILPPPISMSRDDSDEQSATATDAEEAPAPRRRTRRPTVTKGDAADETVKAAG